MNEPSIPDEAITELARQLGARAAERVDLERTAAAVLTRLRQAPEVRAPWRPMWLALAATLVVLVGAGAGLREFTHRPSAAVVGPAAVDVSDLSARQLGEALQGLDQPEPSTVDEEPPPTIESGVEDLTPAELRSLLNALTT